MLFSGKIKKIIAGMAAVVMALALVPVVSFAAADYTNTDPAAGPTISTKNATNSVYGNGFALVVTSADNDTNVYWDKDRDGVVDAEDVLVSAGAVSPNVYGGVESGSCGDTQVVVLETGRNSLYSIYGGGAVGTTVNGNVSVVMNDGSTTYIYGSARSSYVTGNVTVTVNGGTIDEIAAQASAYVTGVVTLNINGGKIITAQVAERLYSQLGACNELVTNMTGGNVQELLTASIDQNYKVPNGTTCNWSGGVISSLGGGTRNLIATANNYVTLNLSGDLTCTYGLALSCFDEINITGELTGADGAILGRFGKLPADTVYVKSGATEENAKKFAVNYAASSCEKNMGLKYKNGQILCGTFYIITTMDVGGVLGAGKPTERTYQVYEGESMPAVLKPNEPKGKIFEGYFTMQDGEGMQLYEKGVGPQVYPSVNSYPYASNITLYPKWRIYDPSILGRGIDVQGKVVPSLQATYKVDIGWGEMKFTYTKDPMAWNPETHSYASNKPGVWSGLDDGQNNRITVKNHSNAAVIAGFAFAGNTQSSGIVTDWFSDQALQTKGNWMSLAYCPLGAVDSDVPAGVRYMQVSGEPKKLKYNDSFKVAGIITVTIGADTVNTGLTPDI